MGQSQVDHSSLSRCPVLNALPCTIGLFTFVMGASVAKSVCSTETEKSVIQPGKFIRLDVHWSSLVLHHFNLDTCHSFFNHEFLSAYNIGVKMRANYFGYCN